MSNVSILQRVYRRYASSSIRTRELSRMSRSTGGAVLLSEAIRDVANRHFDPNELTYIEKIENLRDELASSQDSISFVDYGAGEPEERVARDEMYRGRLVTRSVEELCRRTSKKYPWAHLLFQIIRKLRPAVCLELGTCIGISAAYQAAALELNQSGKLLTLEGAEPLAALARRNFERLGFHRIVLRVGRFQDTLEDALREYAPVHFSFVDGHHDEQATLSYFDHMFPFLSEGAVLVFDDILWYEGMQKAWKTITADARVKIAIDLGAMGICVTTKVPGDKQAFGFRID
jgi:predicted O-methyltransferase YrrM